MTTKITAPVGVRNIALAAAMSCGLATAAQASTFTWDFSGTIAAPTATSVSGEFFGGGTSTLSWGTGNDPVNSLSILASQGSTNLNSGEDTSVNFGSISWTNASTFNSGGVWDTMLSLGGTFGNQGFGSVSDTASISINVENTTDTDSSVDENDASGEIPDIITLNSLNSGSFGVPSINLGGGMSLLGFSAELLSTGQCGTAKPNSIGSFLLGDSWGNCEGNTSVLGLSALVRYEEPIAPIPLPAAGWLLLGSLAGLGALRKRRKK